MKLNALVPEFYVSNFSKSLHFYVDVLGFEIQHEREDPLFALLAYGEAQLMIQENDENPIWHTGSLEKPYGRGINFQIRAEDLDGLLRRLEKMSYPLRRGAEETWRKANDAMVHEKEFLVLDPDGYLLRFSKYLGSRPI